MRAGTKLEFGSFSLADKRDVSLLLRIQVSKWNVKCLAWSFKLVLLKGILSSCRIREPPPPSYVFRGQGFLSFLCLGPLRIPNASDYKGKQLYQIQLL